MVLNSTQSNLEDLKVDNNPKEVIEQFYDFFNNIPFIKSITKADRKRAKDLPRDEEGKIKVNITEPHILEDMDYFRPSAIHFQKYGCYTKLRPNPNPNSEGFFFGHTKVTANKILIDTKDFEGKTLPQITIEITILHEMIHAILSSGQYESANNDEPLVEWLANCIYSIKEQGKL